MLLAAPSGVTLYPVPFMLAVAFSSSIGSALSVTGNPQNMYIGIVSGMPYAGFMLYTLVPVALSLVLAYLVLSRMYKKDLGAITLEINEEAPLNNREHLLYDRVLIIKSLITLALVLILFLLDVGYPFAALVGATAIILCGRITPRIALAKVDWQLLIFFAGLFVVMGTLEQTSFMESLLQRAETVMGGSELSAIGIIGSVTLLLSNLVSNLPAVMMIYPALEHLMLPDKFSAYLALVSTFAGNLTIIGSVANIIVVERARMAGVNISFMTYLKAGAVITLGSTIFATGYILIIP